MLKPARLLTCFGTQVYFDAVSGRLRHGDIGSVPANVALVADEQQASSLRIGRLVCDVDGVRLSIECRSDRCVIAAAGPTDDDLAGETALRVLPLERGLFALTANGKFLTADSVGGVALAASVCRTWELFLATEEWCTLSAPGSADSHADHPTPAVDTRSVRTYTVHPMIRLRTGARPRNLRILIFGYTGWSHGRVYYDLCKHLYDRGFIVDLLDWQGNHHEYIKDLSSFYDFFLVALDGISVLANIYGVPHERMIAVSHSEYDIRILTEQKSEKVFDQFAGYGVVSESVYCASRVRGVPRPPLVASLGINYGEFLTDPPQELKTVGYATSMATTTFGVEWKRGHLAEKAAREAGLKFAVAGSTGNQVPFHDMASFYKTVDSILMSSITEAAPLPVMEAAAAGRLVIGTPVGHFPLRAYQGGGILAPADSGKFVSFCADTLRYYKGDRVAFQAKCREIQQAARKFDWQHNISGWIELLEAAKAGAGGRMRRQSAADGSADSRPRKAYRFAADGLGADAPAWTRLLDELAPRRIVEIGCHEGRVTCHLIEQCSRIGAVQLVCIDTWRSGANAQDGANQAESNFDHNVDVARVLAQHAVMLRKVKRTPAAALSEIVACGEPAFDLVCVAGSFSAAELLTIAAIAFQVLRIGGVMILAEHLWRDEIGENPTTIDESKGGAECFVNLFRQQINVVAGYPADQLCVERIR